MTEKSVGICNPQSPEILQFSCNESLSLMSPKAGLQPQHLWILKHKPLTSPISWLSSSTPLKKIRDPVSKLCGYMVQLLRKDQEQRCLQALSPQKRYFAVLALWECSLKGFEPQETVVLPVRISLHDEDSATRRGKEGGGPPTPPQSQQGQAHSLWRSFVLLPCFSGDRGRDKCHL